MVSFVVPGWTTGRKRVGTGGRRTEKYILKDNRLLRKSAEIVDCDARGRLLLDACPGEVHVEEEKEYLGRAVEEYSRHDPYKD